MLTTFIILSVILVIILILSTRKSIKKSDAQVSSLRGYTNDNYNRGNKDESVLKTSTKGISAKAFQHDLFWDFGGSSGGSSSESVISTQTPYGYEEKGNVGLIIPHVLEHNNQLMIFPTLNEAKVACDEQGSICSGILHQNDGTFMLRSGEVPPKEDYVEHRHVGNMISDNITYKTEYWPDGTYVDVSNYDNIEAAKEACNQYSECTGLFYNDTNNTYRLRKGTVRADRQASGPHTFYVKNSLTGNHTFSRKVDAFEYIVDYVAIIKPSDSPDHYYVLGADSYDTLHEAEEACNDECLGIHEITVPGFSGRFKLQSVYEPYEVLLNPPEINRYYSSAWNTNWKGTHETQSMLDSEICWVPHQHRIAADSWMYIDLASECDVTGVVIQGRNTTVGPSYMRLCTFELEYLDPVSLRDFSPEDGVGFGHSTVTPHTGKNDDRVWRTIVNPNPNNSDFKIHGDVTFDHRNPNPGGNGSSPTGKTQTAHFEAVRTRYIKIRPKTWGGEGIGQTVTTGSELGNNVYMTLGPAHCRELR